MLRCAIVHVEVSKVPVMLEVATETSLDILKHRDVGVVGEVNLRCISIRGMQFIILTFQVGCDLEPTIVYGHQHLWQSESSLFEINQISDVPLRTRLRERLATNKNHIECRR